ncbi:MAG: hypothetical protein M3071_06510 [Actinomycetota bacterium]|nr:hypothetical protein [Actinomycetota bacterium]
MTADLDTRSAEAYALAGEVLPGGGRATNLESAEGRVLDDGFARSRALRGGPINWRQDR